VLSAPTDEAALGLISVELEDRLKPLTTIDEREQIHRLVLKLARRSDRTTPRLQREDIFGGLAVCLMILLATLPILVPFLIVSNTMVAIRISNLTALAIQFWLGYAWARKVGINPFYVGAGVTSIGIILVLITIALGG
jgi:VIT1/CCC1 family predicted Fe2+/Mn2+ transporter